MTAKGLTPKAKAFIDIYVATGNATQSYIDAGYSATSRTVAHSNAKKLMQKPAVLAYWNELIASKNGEKIAKQDEVLEFLTKVMRGEVVEQFPIGLGMGEQKLVKKDLDGSDRIRAAELIGKRYSMWVDRQQVEGSVVVFTGDDNLED